MQASDVQECAAAQGIELAKKGVYRLPISAEEPNSPGDAPPHRCLRAVRAKMSHSLKTFADAPGEKFAAPDRAIIPITRAVEADAADALLPFASLCNHRGHVCAVVLNALRFGRRKRSRARRGRVVCPSP